MDRSSGREAIHVTPETLICAENIAPERLSALRDESLPADEAQRLREHVTGCPACQARLADYDALAAALRQQRELEPGERIVEGVRARLAAPSTARRRRWRRPSRRLWAGLATLAPVAAIILLFVYVFGGLGSHMRPAAGKTPTAQATPAPTLVSGKHAGPTATPPLVTLPPFPPAYTLGVAWGALTPMETFSTPPVARTQFAVNTLSPDATMLVGTSMPTDASTAGLPRVDLVSYAFAGHTWKTLGPHWSGYSGPWGGASAVSDRYIVYGFNSQAGATCDVCNNTLWAYDRQTGASWEIEPGTQAGAQFSGDQGDFTSGDHVAFTTVEDQVWVANLAARQVTLALPPGAQPASATSSGPQPNVRLDGFSWPYLIYDYTPVQSDPNTPVATTLRIANLQTRATTVMPQPIDTLFQFPHSAGYSSGLQTVYISGDTLYAIVGTNVEGVWTDGAPINTSYDTLYRLNHVFSGGGSGQPEILTRWSPQQAYGSERGINARLILLDGGYAWDIAEGRLVTLNLTVTSAPSDLAATTVPGVSLAGNYLLMTSSATDSATGSTSVTGEVYDTTTLPIH